MPTVVQTIPKGDSGDSRLPIPEAITADNGLQIQSNSKHTPGMPGNRPNAGTEPRNSLDLFEKSVPGGERVRYAIDADGNINRFSGDKNGVYHWNGATGDVRAPLDVSTIPIKIRRDFGFKGK
jgi:filamentous hemagglutinin